MTGPQCIGESAVSRSPNRFVLLGESAEMSQLADALEARGAAVECTTDLLNFVEETKCQPPHCVVFDLRGNDAIARALALYCRDVSRLVLVLTGLNDIDDRLYALSLGVADYAIVPGATRELVARAEQLAGRQQLLRRRRVDAGGVVLDLQQHAVTRHGRLISLTPREFTVLELLMRNSMRIVSKAELLRDAWDGAYRTANVVEATVSSLRRKLHDAGPPVIHTVHRVGYVFRPEISTRVTSTTSSARMRTAQPRTTKSTARMANA